MKTRLITGLSLFAVFVALAWLDIKFINFIIFALILTFAYFESLKLYKVEQISGYFVALLGLCLLPFFDYEAPFSTAFKIICLMITIVAGFLVWKKSENLRSILPLLYPTTPILLLLALYLDLGILHLVWLIVTIVLSDSGAYFIGKAIGKTPFSKSSPNKTLEGVIGGVATGMVCGLIFANFAFDNYHINFMLFVSFLSVFFGVFGDLFESYLKRSVGIKDSGNLFPGHGGMLDRIDGYLFGVIAFAVIFAW